MTDSLAYACAAMGRVEHAARDGKLSPGAVENIPAG